MNVNSVNLSFLWIYSEVEQSLASAIADRATDEVVEALTRYLKEKIYKYENPTNFSIC